MRRRDHGLLFFISNWSTSFLEPYLC